jgi:hypothetical protein
VRFIGNIVNIIPHNQVKGYTFFEGDSLEVHIYKKKTVGLIAPGSTLLSAIQIIKRIVPGKVPASGKRIGFFL